jgi:alpha-L-fucosidase
MKKYWRQSIDDKEEAILEGIAVWMDVNKECIFGTRPWKIFGEGPATAGAELEGEAFKFNEGKGKPLTWEDVRFTTKGDTLYVIILDAPEGRELRIKSLGLRSPLVDGRKVKSVELLGSCKKLNWKQTKDNLKVTVPGKDIAVLKIKGVLE